MGDHIIRALFDKGPATGLQQERPDILCRGFAGVQGIVLQGFLLFVCQDLYVEDPAARPPLDLDQFPTDRRRKLHGIVTLVVKDRLPGLNLSPFLDQHFGG